MEKMVVACPKCQKQLRVPSEGDLGITCPHCRFEWEIIRSQGDNVQAHINNIEEIPGLKDIPLDQLQKVFEKIKNTKVNVMVVGGTGVGKSSTINGLFENAGVESSAKVGESGRPETMEVKSYSLNNVVIWDTPGLGDSTEQDARHIQKITKLLNDKDEDGHPLIDVALLVVDGSSRDFGSVYKLIKDVIAPNLNQNGDTSRLLIAINKIDKIKHHSYWDTVNNCPTEKLQVHINDLVTTVQDRIEADTGFRPEIITYCAGESDNGEMLQTPYNLGKLLSFLLDRVPSKKRIAFSNDINKDKKNFKSNDEKENYSAKVEKTIYESFKEVVVDVLGSTAKIAGEVLKEVVTSPQVRKVLKDLGVAALKSFFTKGK